MCRAIDRIGTERFHLCNDHSAMIHDKPQVNSLGLIIHWFMSSPLIKQRIHYSICRDMGNHLQHQCSNSWAMEPAWGIVYRGVPRVFSCIPFFGMCTSKLKELGFFFRNLDKDLDYIFAGIQILGVLFIVQCWNL